MGGRWSLLDPAMPAEVSDHERPSGRRGAGRAEVPDRRHFRSSGVSSIRRIKTLEHPITTKVFPAIRGPGTGSGSGLDVVNREAGGATRHDSGTRNHGAATPTVGHRR